MLPHRTDRAVPARRPGRRLEARWRRKRDATLRGGTDDRRGERVGDQVRVREPAPEAADQPLRDRYQALQQVMERQRVITTAATNQDVIALARDNGNVCVEVFFVRNGKLLGREFFMMEGGNEEDEQSIVAAFLQQFYTEAAMVPPEILLPAQVAEAAVVGYPHDIKGQGIYAYGIAEKEITDADLARKDIIASVVKAIGPIAKPDKIQFVSGLPKTRSGKIMRRILRKVAENELASLGDTSTLLDPAVVDEIKAGKL